MATTIASLFEDEEEGLLIAEKCNQDGGEMMKYLHGEAQKVSTQVSSAIETEMNRMLKAGLASASISSFNHFKREYGEWNQAQRNPLPAPIVAAHLQKVVEKLGPKIESTLRRES